MGAAVNRFRFGIALRRISGASPAHDILISTTICWWRCWCCYRDTNLCLPLIDVLHIIIIFMQISNKERREVIIANVWCVYRLGCQNFRMRWDMNWANSNICSKFNSCQGPNNIYLIFSVFIVLNWMKNANSLSSQITEK